MPNSLLSRTPIRKIGSFPLPAYPRHSYGGEIGRHINTLKLCAKVFPIAEKMQSFHYSVSPCILFDNTAYSVPYTAFLGTIFQKKMYAGVYSPDTCQNVSPLRHVYGLIYFLTAMAVCFASSYNFLSYNTTKAVPHHKKRAMNYQKSTALNICIYLPLLTFLLLGKFSQTFISIFIHIVPVIRKQVAAG